MCLCVWIVGYFKLDSPLLQQRLLQQRQTHDNMTSAHAKVRIQLNTLVDPTWNVCHDCIKKQKSKKNPVQKRTNKRKIWECYWSIYVFMYTQRNSVKCGITCFPSKVVQVQAARPGCAIAVVYMRDVSLSVQQDLRSALGRRNKATEYSSSSDEFGSSDDEDRSRWRLRSQHFGKTFQKVNREPRKKTVS